MSFFQDNINRFLERPDQSRDQWSLTRTGWAVLWLLLFLFLLPMLTFPLGPDNGLFFVAGEKIAHQGAVHYRDIVDVKPPLIYYLNALAITLFGDHPTSIRILDLLLQLLTAFFLVRLIRRTSENDLWAATALLLYPFLYLSLNFANTAQVESFLGVLLLPGISLLLFRRTPSGFLVIGLLCGVATILKFTFGITLAGMLLGDLLLYRDPWKERLRRYIPMGLGFGIIVALFLLYLVAFDAWTGFQQMQEFLSGYTGVQFTSIGDLLRNTLTQLPRLMSDEYSLLMLISTLVALGIAFVSDTGRENQEEHQAGIMTSRLLRISSLLFLLLLATIAIEAKWIHYHLSRLYPLAALLGGYGLFWLCRKYIAGWKKNDPFRWIGMILFLVLLFGFSPLTRYVFHLRPTVLLLTKGEEAFDAYYAHTRTDDDWTMEDIREIGGFIRPRLQPGERVFISSGVAGLIYREIGYIPDFHIFHSGFLIAPFSPDAWLDSTISYLTSKRPRFIVLQTSDRMAIITGTNETSQELFDRIPELSALLRERYDVVMERPGFKVYELR